VIPIILTTFGRSALLRQMIASFNKTRWPSGREYHLFVHDDGSGPRVFDALDAIAIPHSVRRERRIGMIWQNLWAIHYAMDRTDHYVIKVESDALFHPDWLLRLTELYESLSKNQQVAQASAFTWKKYYPHNECVTHRRLREAGGVACILDCKFWISQRIGERTVIRARRNEHAKRPLTSWPYWIAKAAKAVGAWIVATRPSYVQHMGTEVYSSKSAPQAVATDFVGEVPDCPTAE